MEIFFKISNANITYLLTTNPNSLIFSIIIGYSIYAIILSIVQQTSKATTISSIIICLLLLINQIKILYTGEPIYFYDINFLSKINDLANMLSSNVVFMSIRYGIILIIMGIILFFLSRWNQKNEIKITNIKMRIGMLLTGVLIIIIFFIPNDYTKELYLNLFFNMKEHKDYNSYTTNLDFYIENTFISGMYGVLLNNRFSEPQNYNEEKLENSLLLASENSKEWEKPNIIVVFSEAFWDVNKIDEVKFNKEVTENYKRLSNEGKLIDLVSCTYGGMSENVAFELLTGGSMNYFTKGYIPVMSLYNRKNSNDIPSIIKELKNNGYKTKITFGKDYYNSENAFLKMGFDEYVELEETSENIKGNYISDEYMIDTIINDMAKKTSEQKVFYMVETIQNHMLYNLEKYKNYDINIEDSNFDEDMNNTILAYAQGIYDADKQLNRLYEYIQEYEEPTIILFLGDHLPYLYTNNGENVIESLNYFNSSNELLNTYRKYNTQALIVANYQIDYDRIPPYLSTDLLLTYMVNQMDINLSEYYKWLYNTISNLPAFNNYISLDNNGNIYDINDLPENIGEKYNLRECMQFKFFIKPTL